MAHTTDTDKRAAAQAASAQAPDGGDVKIDIEVEGEEAKTSEAEQAPEPTAAAEPEVPVADEATEAQPGAAAEGEPGAEMSEEEMVAAAIAAGEAAANDDFKLKYDQAKAKIAELRKQLDGELEAAKAEASTAADRFARLQADWDNYRRRTERERVTERERACEGLVKDLLPAIDDLERAIEHAGAAEGEEVAKQLVEGVSAVHAKVLSVLERQGVEVISPAGEAFDPMEHQAVGRVENSEAFDETVADVYQKGYRIAGKVIRPAMVTVSYGGPKRPAEPEAPEGEPDAGAKAE